MGYHEHGLCVKSMMDIEKSIQLHKDSTNGASSNAGLCHEEARSCTNNTCISNVNVITFTENGQSMLCNHCFKLRF